MNELNFLLSLCPAPRRSHGVGATTHLNGGVNTALLRGARWAVTLLPPLQPTAPYLCPPFLCGSHALRKDRSHRRSREAPSRAKAGKPGAGLRDLRPRARTPATAVRWHRRHRRPGTSPPRATPGPSRLGSGSSEPRSAHVPTGRSLGETEAARAGRSPPTPAPAPRHAASRPARGVPT